MRSAKIEKLTHEAFRPFGSFVQMINPDTEVIGEKPVQFFRDMLTLDINNPSVQASFSICRVEERPRVVDVSEYHSCCAEGNLPLDADILIHVAPATPNGVVPHDKIRIFRVPKGTFLTMRPGVWHHAPFVDGGAKAANVVIVLPERTYANDCVVVELKDAEKVKIEG